MSKQYWADCATINCVWCFQVMYKEYGEEGCLGIRGLAGSGFIGWRGYRNNLWRVERHCFPVKCFSH